MKGSASYIDLAILATDARSEVPAMVRELEGVGSDHQAPNRGAAARFILAGAKLAYGSKKAGARN